MGLEPPPLHTHPSARDGDVIRDFDPFSAASVDVAGFEKKLGAQRRAGRRRRRHFRQKYTKLLLRRKKSKQTTFLKLELGRRDEHAVLVGVHPVARPHRHARHRHRHVAQPRVALAALQRVGRERFDAERHAADVVAVADAAVDDDALCCVCFLSFCFVLGRVLLRVYVCACLGHPQK